LARSLILKVRRPGSRVLRVAIPSPTVITAQFGSNADAKSAPIIRPQTRPSAPHSGWEDHHYRRPLKDTLIPANHASCDIPGAE
jgi:hypothetical protein